MSEDTAKGISRWATWDEMPMMLTAEEAAEILRVHPTTVKAMCRDGDIKAVKAGRAWRILRDDLRAFVEKR